MTFRVAAFTCAALALASVSAAAQTTQPNFVRVHAGVIAITHVVYDSEAIYPSIAGQDGLH